MLQIDQLDNDLKKTLAVAFCVNTAINNTNAEDGINAIVSEVNDVDKNDKLIVDVEDYRGAQLDFYSQYTN